MKKCLVTNKLPPPVGPYSQMVVANGFLFLSGQIPVDLVSGKLVRDDIEIQTETILKAINAALEEQHLTMKDIVKVTAYLVNPDDFNNFNKIYSKYFNDEPPARTTVFVSSLPKGARVEIDVIIKTR